MFSAIPLPYRLLGAAVFISAVFFVGMLEGRSQVQAVWNESVIKQSLIAAQAEADSRAKEQSMQQKLNEAQHAASEREIQLRADYDAARRAALGLRDTVGTLRGQLSSTTAETCRATADAALAVFGECAAEAGRLAEAADGHASDVRLFSDAWPE